MSVLGYIFPDQSVASPIPIGEQQRSIRGFGLELGENVDNFLIEEGSSLKRPFRQRKEGKRVLNTVQPGDVIITMKAEWVLGSAKEGLWLVKTLHNKAVSLYCVDLQENISLPIQRKLVVSEGSAVLIKKLLHALSVCESSKHGESIRAAKRQMKKEGKYLGGPIPFGWKVDNGYLERDRAKQEIIEEILRLRGDRWSYRDIVGKLKEKFGVKLSHEGVRRIMINIDRP